MSEIMAKTRAIVKEGLALGADEVIATTVLGTYRQTRFSNNQIDIGVAWHDYATGVFLTLNKRVVATEIKNFQDVEGTLSKLLKLATVSRENPLYGGVAHGHFAYDSPAADEGIRRLEDPADYIHAALDAARTRAGKAIDSGGILATKHEDVFLVSSEGPEGRDTRSAIEFSIRVFSERDASGHGVECSSSLQHFHPERAGEKAGEIAQLAEHPKAGTPGKYDVIFDPLFVGSLLAVYGTMGSAYNVMINMSMFADKLGTRVAPEMVTIRDDPGLYSVNRRAFDEEGVPVKGTIAVENGVLTSYFHNTSTAKYFDTTTTGHAGLVVPMPWNLEMDAGEIQKAELFHDLKRGLYLTNTWYTRFQNYATGEFSTLPRDGAFLIEGGEIVASWRDIRISDNLLNMLGNITGISKERQHVRWWLEADPPSLSPYVLVRDVQITKPT